MLKDKLNARIRCFARSRQMKEANCELMLGRITRTITCVVVGILLSGCGLEAAPAPTPDKIRVAMTAVVETKTAVAELPPAETPVASLAPGAEAYLSEALAIMRANALNTGLVNWERVERAAMAGADGAINTTDTYGAIRFALRELNDRHSHFLTPEEVLESEEQTIAHNPPLSSQMIHERIGYIDVPGFESLNPEAIGLHAAAIQSHLTQLSAQSPCGWIVDLQSNVGGNMWPMLAGLGPLLGDGPVGYFMAPETEAAPWLYEWVWALMEEQEEIAVEEEPLQAGQGELPVAVLIGESTASSGEAVAIAFHGRERTRFFGAPTLGLTTANEGFELVDGAMIFVTTARFADRGGAPFGGEIIPDETAEQGQASIDAATTWLLEQPACSGA